MHPVATRTAFVGSVFDALMAGFLVGLSVAVLVGGAAMTVLETAIHRGTTFALAAGAGVATGDGVVGAFVASLSWQGVLVAAGTCRGRSFSARARRVVLAVDCLLLALFIFYLALSLYR